jgi:hypothetical protein
MSMSRFSYTVSVFFSLHVVTAACNLRSPFRPNGSCHERSHKPELAAAPRSWRRPCPGSEGVCCSQPGPGFVRRLCSFWPGVERPFRFRRAPLADARRISLPTVPTGCRSQCAPRPLLRRQPNALSPAADGRSCSRTRLGLFVGATRPGNSRFKSPSVPRRQAK